MEVGATGVSDPRKRAESRADGSAGCPSKRLGIDLLADVGQINVTRSKVLSGMRMFFIRGPHAGSLAR